VKEGSGHARRNVLWGEKKKQNGGKNEKIGVSLSCTLPAIRKLRETSKDVTQALAALNPHITATRISKGRRALLHDTFVQQTGGGKGKSLS